MKCKNCGSALEIEPGQAFSKCEYCGHSTRVRSARTLIAESRREERKREREERKHEREERVSERRAASPRRSSRVRGFFSMIVPLLIVGATLVFTVFPSLSSLSSVPWRTWPGISSLPFFQEQETESIILEGNERQQLSGVARGTTPASTLATSECEGFLRETPDARVATLRPGLVHFDVVGNGDLTLAVKTSEGNWLCDDDSAGSLLPRIVQALPVGSHEVWVGRFSNSESIDYELFVSEDQPELPRPVVSEEDKAERRRSHRRRRRRHRASHMRETSMEEPSSPSEMVPEPAATETLAGAGDGEMGQSAMPMDTPTQNVARGMISVQTTPWARLRVNGRQMGNTPQTNIVVRADARVEVQREGEGAWVRLPLRVVPGEVVVLHHTF